MYREIYFERNEKVAAKINTRIYKYLFTKLENLHSVTSQLQLMVPMAYYEICETIRTIGWIPNPSPFLSLPSRIFLQNLLFQVINMFNFVL
jgi:hypothetical protein